MKWLSALAVVSAVVCAPSDARACATMETPFSYALTHPDRPVEVFASGKLGVLQPTYRPMFLIVAYRLMVGLPLTAEQQSELVGSWRRELGDVSATANTEGVEAWKKAVGDDAPPDPDETTDYASYQRINKDAFFRALQTRRELQTVFASFPQLTEEWLETQKAVFGSCGGEGQLPSFADRSNEGIPAALLTRRADERKYQEAAVSLYCGNWDEAVQRFEAISKSKTSPWRGWGKFLAARALLRKASLTFQRTDADNDAAYAVALRVPEARLKDVISDPSARPSWPAARRLYGLVRFRTEPEKRRCELFGKVLEVGSGAALESEIVDLSLLLRDASGKTCLGLKGAPTDLEDWLRVLAGRDAPASYDAAKEHWKDSRSVPWLVAALMTARAQSPELAPVLEAAKAVDVAAPWGVTVHYYAGRLFRWRGEAEAARAMIASLKPELAGGTGSANLIKSELTLTAKGWPDVYANVARVTAGIDEGAISDEDDRPEKDRERFFGVDAGTLSRSMTAARILEMSKSAAIPAELRRQLRWTAFTRATLVNDEATMTAAAKELIAAEPSAKAELEAMLARKTPEDRRMDAQLLLMGLPVVSPVIVPGLDRYWSVSKDFNLTNDESYSRNWWCPVDPLSTEPNAWGFVDAAETKAAEAQWEALVRVGSAMSYFSALAMAWAKAHPDDPRAPIALYRVVRMSKRGCGAQNTKEAQEAFRYLHQKYPKSEWAVRAKYVY